MDDDDREDCEECGGTGEDPYDCLGERQCGYCLGRGFIVDYGPLEEWEEPCDS
jgi:DnaJ-class molecular chaperone